MWSLLSSLISTFLLLRDLFGYAIPGAVLLAISDRYEHPDLSKVPLINDSIWIKLVVAVTAAYVVGHVLAAIGYSFYQAVDSFRGWWKGLNEEERKEAEAKQVESKISALYFRYLYPSMFIEADRRETLTILRVALSVALLISAALPVDVPMTRRAILAAVGLFMLWNVYDSRRVAQTYADLSNRSGQRAATNHIPAFHWGGGGSGSAPPDDESAEKPGTSQSAFTATGTLAVTPK